MTRFPALRHANAANAITTLAAACAMGAILASARGAPRAAVLLLMGAILGDKLDGAVARRLGQSSDFGRELDSLADALGFCVAPALLGAFRGLPSWALVAAGLYTLAGLWRLAHFNVTGLAGEGRDERFTGVPTTIAASWFLLALVGLEGVPGAPALLGASYVVLGLLMVSAVPFRKHGLAVKSLYVLLPLAALVTLLR
jgi:CDP-diacylglycerol--serine O-phosphatidyltransferase